MAASRLCQRTFSAFKPPTRLWAPVSSRCAPNQVTQHPALTSHFSLITQNLDAFSPRPIALCCSECTKINYRKNGTLCANFPQVPRRLSPPSTVVQTFVECRPESPTVVRIHQRLSIVVSNLRHSSINIRWPFANVRQLFANVRWSSVNVRQSFTNTRRSFTNTRQSFVDVRQSFANVQQLFVGHVPLGRKS